MLLNFMYVHTLNTERALCITTRTYAYLDNSTTSSSHEHCTVAPIPKHATYAV
jgi:hypothetical protein